jgi:large subunit ribosomal protein L38e
LREFLQKARGDNKVKASARSVTVKNCGNRVTKFKLRCSKYLYTYVVSEPSKTEKVLKSLPPGLTRNEIKKK